MEFIRLDKNRGGFIKARSGQRFVPWGFNYDHDAAGRLIEDYWDAEWPAIVGDFQEMRALGANVVRIHLQFGKFMRDAQAADPHALQQFARLIRLAEQTGLHLDVTGLGCYHRQDVPSWYDALDERGRWVAQARFWSVVARVGRGSPAIFCYDLMNEPVAPHRAGSTTNWLGPAFAGKHFVQWISREGGGRDRTEVARTWIRQLSSAIRAMDPDHLITVGLVDWSLPRPGLDSGFHPEAIASDLDFLSVHLYPESGRIETALDTLRAFAAAGKPVVIEETFILKCSVAEFDEFFGGAKAIAVGWIGFYWGRPPAELRPPANVTDSLTLAWLEWFQRHSR